MTECAARGVPAMSRRRKDATRLVCNANQAVQHNQPRGQDESGCAQVQTLWRRGPLQIANSGVAGCRRAKPEFLKRLGRQQRASQIRQPTAVPGLQTGHDGRRQRPKAGFKLLTQQLPPGNPSASWSWTTPPPIYRGCVACRILASRSALDRGKPGSGRNKTCISDGQCGTVISRRPGPLYRLPNKSATSAHGVNDTCAAPQRGIHSAKNSKSLLAPTGLTRWWLKPASPEAR